MRIPWQFGHVSVAMIHRELPEDRTARISSPSVMLDLPAPRSPAKTTFAATA